MSEIASYVIVGNGRWAGIIAGVLSRLPRPCRILKETRRREEETSENFRSRLSSNLSASGAAIAWICIPPCAEIPFIIEASITAGLHVIVEKPWLYPKETTEPLAEFARIQRVLVAVHFQYCFLAAIESLKLRAETLINPAFGGTFTVSRPDRLGIPALYNLGSHLLAIREYALPASNIAALECAYDSKDERVIRIHAGQAITETLQLTTREPIVERFIAKVEAATESLDFPLNLRLASRVFEALSSVSGNPQNQT